MAKNYPFVYIAALMRTGSTVLSESLTNLPQAFIFREPHIGKNTFRAKPADIALFKEHGLDLDAFLKFRNPLAFVLRRFRFAGLSQDYMVRALKFRLLPRMAHIAQQVGVKEIDNRSWQNYYQHFPDMRVILTGRDPRDVYISVYRRWEKGLRGRRKTITPQAIADELNAQFALQLEIAQQCEHLKVAYEELCLAPDMLTRVREFVNSPLVTAGDIGQFNASHPHRRQEYQLHGDQITDQRVQRWRRETDVNLLKAAQQVFEAMPDYVSFWGYK